MVGLAILFSAVAVETSSAGELSWRRGRAPSNRPAPRAESQWRGGWQSKSNAASHAEQGRAEPRGAVRLVQYIEESDQSRSMLVDRDERDAHRPTRTAQLDFRAPNDSRYEESILAPFGDDATEEETDQGELVDDQMSEDLFPSLDDPTGESLPAEEPTAPDEGQFDAPEPIFEPEPRRDPPTQPQVEPRRPAVQRPRSFQPLPDRPDTTTLAPEYSVGEFSDDLSTSDESSCSEELAKLRASTLHDVDLAIDVAGVEGRDYPVECSIDDGTAHPGRAWPETVYMWKASALCHKPLYFENESLERYGHSWGPYCDPLVSGAHFFSRLPVLPYCMGLATPNECQYALGHYRPGNCAPYTINPVPITTRAVLFQAGAVTGAAVIIP